MLSPLILNCVLYTGAAAAEYWLFGWLAIFGIKLPIFSALLQNASWSVQILFYNLERKKLSTIAPRIITNDMYRSYIILGLLSSFITLTRTIGLTSLPPTIYVICANTEIVFETFMTRIVLQREYQPSITALCNICRQNMFTLCRSSVYLPALSIF